MVSVKGWSLSLFAAFTVIIVFIILYAGNLVKEKALACINAPCLYPPYLVIFHPWQQMNSQNTLTSPEGWIRILHDALRMIEAGALRIGTSAGVKVLEEFKRGLLQNYSRGNNPLSLRSGIGRSFSSRYRIRRSSRWGAHPSELDFQQERQTVIL